MYVVRSSTPRVTTPRVLTPGATSVSMEMFGRRRKKNNKQEEDHLLEEEDVLCTVCGNPAKLTNRRIKNVPGWMPPGVLMVNDHDVPGVEESLTMYFCRPCLEVISRFIAYQLEIQDEVKKEKVILERLGKLNVGTVLTMIEDEIHPLPEAEIRDLLAQTPFGTIWNV